MEALYSTSISTSYGEKTISVYNADIMAFDREIDILTTSAVYRSYYPTEGSLFRSLDKAKVSVLDLSRDPEIDLRESCNVWLSRPIDKSKHLIKRIGCIEMTHRVYRAFEYEYRSVNKQEMFKSLRAYFQMLDVAATCGVKMDTVAIPVIGSGNQNIAEDLVIFPLINECIQFLKRNSEVKRLYFIERSPQKAFRIAKALTESYSVTNEQLDIIDKARARKNIKPIAFISHSSKDKNIADNLCAKLEAKNIRVWYAPRDVQGPYAKAIAEAITRATHFIVILSKNSMSSQHVLNEVDLAFKRLPDRIKFKTLRIDGEELLAEIEYYLSRQHWMEATIPPLEQRLNEFVDHIINDLYN